MAMQVRTQWIGVDVAKDELVVASCETEECQCVVNQKRAIAAYLSALSGPVAMAIEATSIYHLEWVEQAYRRGHSVYLIDGYRLKRYRESIGGRAKTDATDAKLLLRYLTHEHEHLRPWTPPPRGYANVQGLLRRRAVLVHAQTMLRQSLQGVSELKAATTTLMRCMNG